MGKDDGFDMPGAVSLVSGTKPVEILNQSTPLPGLTSLYTAKSETGEQGEFDPISQIFRARMAQADLDPNATDEDRAQKAQDILNSMNLEIEGVDPKVLERVSFTLASYITHLDGSGHKGRFEFFLSLQKRIRKMAENREQDISFYFTAAPSANLDDIGFMQKTQRLRITPEQISKILTDLQIANDNAPTTEKGKSIHFPGIAGDIPIEGHDRRSESIDEAYYTNHRGELILIHRDVGRWNDLRLFVPVETADTSRAVISIHSEALDGERFVGMVHEMHLTIRRER